MKIFDGKNFSSRLRPFSGYGLYAVITEKFCGGRSSVEALESALLAGIKIVQLREKEKSKREIYELALRFRDVTRAHGAAFFVNDHIDIALAAGADGVHLGPDDLPLSAARAIAPNLAIGISTHSEAEALAAAAGGADYVNIGPIFSTSTKEGLIKPLGADLARKIAGRIDIPFTVMGGIKEGNLPSAVSTGTSILAMVTEITAAPDIAARVKSLAAALGRLQGIS
ncbi:MAG: thiamine phosphate synthase [Elusimicrobia bacterium HGW-Elusimicrobia-1]|nr:MAG: thiamine phosphate synthase [Elusimicrobia bacterium HGW-Elusimicrobia-3]PKN01843.1 MAG: thiamine phosphate synthase [Elusimicrobia bacterium HGW-Elusimicrobia-1]